MSESGKQHQDTALRRILDEAPGGVRVRRDSQDDTVQLSFHPSGAWGLRVLLSAVLVVTILGGAAWFIHQRPPWYGPIVWALSEVAIICMLLYYLQGRIFIMLGHDELRVETQLIRQRHGWSVNRSAIQEVRRPRSAGSSSVYGHVRRDVLVAAGEDYHVIVSETEERARWVARLLAEWSGATLRSPTSTEEA